MKQAESHRQMKQSKEWERKEKLRVMKKYEDAFHSNEALRKKRNVQKMKAQTHRDLNLQQLERKIMQKIMKNPWFYYNMSY